MKRRFAFWLIAISALGFSTIATAAPANFECDTPKDHASWTDEELDGPMIVSGTVKAVAFRMGDANRPVAGAGLSSLDGINSTSFQLLALTSRPKSLDIILYVKSGEKNEGRVLGQVKAEGEIAFALNISNSNQASLKIGRTIYRFNSPLIAAGRAKVFCSSGNFTFTGLRYGVVGERAPAVQ